LSTLLTRPSSILLTGATSGIGAAMLALLLADGHQVTAVARRASTLPPQPGLTRHNCDLADETALGHWLADLTSDDGFDVIINNAALQYPVPLTDPAFDQSMLAREAAINLVAPARIAHALLPAMLKRGSPSAIVNISSGLAFFPKTNTALYCATKAGLHSFSQSLRYQLADTPVRVIEAILPLVDTPMTAGRGSGKIDAGAAASAILAGIATADEEIYVGKARLLRWLGLIAPAIPRAILKRG
jgi:uncharacterized oxidoreductase